MDFQVPRSSMTRYASSHMEVCFSDSETLSSVPTGTVFYLFPLCSLRPCGRFSFLHVLREDSGLRLSALFISLLFQQIEGDFSDIFIRCRVFQIMSFLDDLPSLGSHDSSHQHNPNRIKNTSKARTTRYSAVFEWDARKTSRIVVSVER